MKFLEIKKGFCVNIEEIQAIESISDMKCKIILENNEFTADFPYKTLINMLSKNYDDKQDKILKELQILNKNDQFFAG